MAQIKVVDHSMVVTLNASVEELKKVQKHNPKILEVNENDSVVFAVGTDKACINPFSASFHSNDLVTGKATVTVLLPPEANDNPKNFIAENYGRQIKYINTIEERLPQALEQIRTEQNAIINSIQ